MDKIVTLYGVAFSNPGDGTRIANLVPVKVRKTDKMYVPHPTDTNEQVRWRNCWPNSERMRVDGNTIGRIYSEDPKVVTAKWRDVSDKKATASYLEFQRHSAYRNAIDVLVSKTWSDA